MSNDHAEEIALHRYAVIAEALPAAVDEGGTWRGRALDRGSHPRPSGRDRTPLFAATIDRWIRAWRAGGLDGLRPQAPVRMPARSGRIRSWSTMRGDFADRGPGPLRGADRRHHLAPPRGAGRGADTSAPSCAVAACTAAALAAEPKVFGRYEAERPNERWITDVLVGPWVPHPQDRHVGAGQAVPDRR